MGIRALFTLALASAASALPLPTWAHCPGAIRIGEVFRAEARLIHPTQVSLGFIEVARRSKDFSERSDLKEYLKGHLVPVVLSPDCELYATDRQHLLAALLLAKLTTRPYLQLEGDYSTLKISREEFLARLARRGWAWPYDENGKRVPVTEIPYDMSDSRNDTYRSLAGVVRNEGGFEKVPGLRYIEFRWANFLRRKVHKRITEATIDRIAEDSLPLVHSAEARGLPGWTPDCSEQLKSK